MDKLKILHINTTDKVGGAAMAAYRLHQEFNREHDSYMLVGHKTGDELKILQIPTYSRNLRRITDRMQNFTGWSELFHQSYFWFINPGNFKNFDIIQLHNIHGGYFNIYSLSRLLKYKKVVWTLHDMWAMTGHCAYAYDCRGWENACRQCPHLNYYPPVKRDWSNIAFNIKRKLLSHPSLYLIAPSRWLKGLVEDGMHPRNEIHLIYNGIDTGIFKPLDKALLREKHGLKKDAKVIIFSAVGRDNPQKGFSYLLKALEQLSAKDDITLLITGDNRDIALNGQGFKIVNLGYIASEEQMAEYYSCADLFLFPSLADNCPLVVLEAMACGLPVISFKTGGIPELVEHLKSGYLAEYRALPDLVNGLELFLNSAPLRTRAGKYAREKALREFSLEKQTQNYLDCYFQILTGGDP
ncbi:glycosyltransferase family 4 protein [bacterium]|nr:glycosyltransferase family 4 protein [bacterium]